MGKKKCTKTVILLTGNCCACNGSVVVPPYVPIPGPPPPPPIPPYCSDITIVPDEEDIFYQVDGSQTSIVITALTSNLPVTFDFTPDSEPLPEGLTWAQTGPNQITIGGIYNGGEPFPGVALEISARNACGNTALIGYDLLPQPDPEEPDPEEPEPEPDPEEPAPEPEPELPPPEPTDPTDPETAPV